MAGMSFSKRKSKRDEGAELIELAIVLPVILLCFAVIVDFGFLFQRFETITNAAREGARLATLPNYTVSDVQGRIANYMAAGGLSGGPTPYVNLTATRTLPSGQTITVAEVVVWYPAGMQYLGPIAGLVGGGGHGSLMLRATSIMRAETAAASGS
jgi:Flp pilus assembly protein TadG